MHKESQQAQVKVLDSIFTSVLQISKYFQAATTKETGTTNTFGDHQLQADVAADRIVFRNLRESGEVAVASSEESTDMHDLGGSAYSVAFDPLDGSSIASANFAIGSIFGIWPGRGLVGRTGREQVAAAYAVYGPRTTIMVATRPSESGPNKCSQYELQGDEWRMSIADVVAGDKKYFAPGNCRAAADNTAYKSLIDWYIIQRYGLRYSGGMVPDVHHVLAKGGGIFCNISSAAAPPRLRLLYECAPMAFIMEAAGGASSDGQISILDLHIRNVENCTQILLGSTVHVQHAVSLLAS